MFAACGEHLGSLPAGFQVVKFMNVSDLPDYRLNISWSGLSAPFLWWNKRKSY